MDANEKCFDLLSRWILTITITPHVEVKYPFEVVNRNEQA